MSDVLPVLLATVPGKVSGIVSLTPMTLQCGDCGVTTANTSTGRDTVFILTAGFNFHPHEPESPRRCPDCRKPVEKECGLCR